jgi:inhibitor of the pro-sigma K processing machinery
MMRTGVWILLIGSLLVVIYILRKNRMSIHWLTRIGLNVVAAALLLYVADWVGASYDFHIPINGGTVAVVGILGLPGMAVLAAVKLWIV